MKTLLFLCFFCCSLCCTVGWAEINNTDNGGPSANSLSPSTAQIRNIPTDKSRQLRDLVRFDWINRIVVFKEKMIQLAAGKVDGFPIENQTQLASVILKGKGYHASQRILADTLLAMAYPNGYDSRGLASESEQSATQLTELLTSIVNDRKVSIQKLQQSIQKYNQFVDSLPVESLQNPNYELALIRWALFPSRTNFGKMQN